MKGFYNAAREKAGEVGWAVERDLDRTFQFAFTGEGPFEAMCEILYDKLIGLPPEVKAFLQDQKKGGKQDATDASVDGIQSKVECTYPKPTLPPEAGNTDGTAISDQSHAAGTAFFHNHEATPRFAKRPNYLPRAADRYIGRVKRVQELALELKPGRRIAVVGPGGIGKTALCAEALKSLGVDAQNPGPWDAGVFSHDFYRQPSYEMALEGLMLQLGGRFPDLDGARAKFVQEHLNRPDALLYLEGCEKIARGDGAADPLHYIIALIPYATVLLTSRERQQAAGSHWIEVGKMLDNESAELLHYHVYAGTKSWPPQDHTNWEAVARRLGGHALAIRLAGQHLRIERLMLRDLVNMMDSEGFTAFDVQRTNKENLGWLFDHSAAAVEQLYPGSVAAWYVLSLHALAPLPLEPIAASLGVCKEEARKALRGLVMHNLAEVVEMPAVRSGQSETGWSLTHALLAEWGRSELPLRNLDDATIYQNWVNWWLEFLANSLDMAKMPGGYQTYRSMVLHFAAMHPTIEHREGESAANMVNALFYTGLAHWMYGDFSAGELLLRRAKHLLEKALGAENECVLHIAVDLATLLLEKGNLAEAELSFANVLKVYKKTLGRNHEETLRCVARFARLFQEKGDLVRAESLFKQALKGRKRSLGVNHRDTVHSMYELAVLLGCKGNIAAAEPLQRQALKSLEQARGLDDPGTLDAVSNLAVLLQSKGRSDFDEAERLFNRALEGHQRIFGPKRPETLSSIHSLAEFLRVKGDLARAEPLFCHALTGREEVLGLMHPETLHSVKGLANLLLMKGDFIAAEPLYKRALDSFEQVFGSEHPKTARARVDLGNLLFQKGELAAAEALYRRALDCFERHLGFQHGDTAKAANNLGAVLERKGEITAAGQFFRRALESFEQVFGSAHPDTLFCVFQIARLAALLQTNGDLNAAEPLYRRALESLERFPGPGHPDTLPIINNLAILLRDKGDVAEAELLFKRLSNKSAP